MSPHGTPARYGAGCRCLECASAASAHRSKPARLERVAAAMREFYLNHGKGCKTRKKVIAGRAK